MEENSYLRGFVEWQCKSNYFAHQFPTLSLRVTVIVEWGRDLEPRDRNKEKEFLAISSISEPTNEIWNAFFANCN